MTMLMSRTSVPPPPSQVRSGATPHPAPRARIGRGLLLVMLLAACSCNRSPAPALDPVTTLPPAEAPAIDTAPALADPTPADVRGPAPPPPTVSTPEQKAAVVRALNTIPIAFDSGAGTVSEDSLKGVADAARALGTTPDLRVQIALPAGDNEALARQRAEALKVQLIINGVSPNAIDTRVLSAGTFSGATTVSFTSASGTQP